MKVYLLCDRYNTDIGTNGVLGLFKSQEDAVEHALKKAQMDYDDAKIKWRHDNIFTVIAGKSTGPCYDDGTPIWDDDYDYQATYIIHTMDLKD